MDAVEIALVAAPDNDVRLLVGELNDELSGLYAAEQRHGLALEAIFQPHIRFFLVRKKDAAIGCGGVALFPGFAEVKRMYVRPAMRGRGIADAIMARLIAEAAQAGLPLLRLETGSHSIAAIRFYGRLGFRHCPAFEPYASMPSQSVVTSVFMEKAISTISGCT
jgi:putative acetyltransferase